MAIKGFGSASIEDINNLQEKYNIKLPQDYCEFLMKYNGGDLSDDGCEVFVKYLDTDIHMDVLFGVNTGNRDLDVDTWTDDYSYDMPPYTIIIGASHEHGLIVLLCEGENAGVYYWDDGYEFECSSDEVNTYFIADTFTEFVQNII